MKKLKIYPISPTFRIIALATNPDQSNQWLTHDLMGIFHFINYSLFPTFYQYGNPNNKHGINLHALVPPETPTRDQGDKSKSPDKTGSFSSVSMKEREKAAEALLDKQLQQQMLLTKQIDTTDNKENNNNNNKYNNSIDNYSVYLDKIRSNVGWSLSDNGVATPRIAELLRVMIHISIISYVTIVIYYYYLLTSVYTHGLDLLFLTCIFPFFYLFIISICIVCRTYLSNVYIINP